MHREFNAGNELMMINVFVDIKFSCLGIFSAAVSGYSSSSFIVLSFATCLSL